MVPLGAPGRAPRLSFLPSYAEAQALEREPQAVISPPTSSLASKTASLSGSTTSAGRAVSTELFQVAQVLAGSLMVAMGIRTRMGGLRSRVLLYRDFRLPWFMRNGAFALVPGGMFFLCTGVAELAGALLPSPFNILTVAIFLPTGIVAMVVGVAWAYRPPDIAKPQWLREEEARYGKPVDPSVWGRRLGRLTLLILLVMGALAFITAVVGAVFVLLGLPVP